MTTERKRKILIDAAFLLLLCGALYLALNYLVIWLLPFLIGFAIALILQKPISKISGHSRFSRSAWSYVLLFVVIASFFGVLAFLLYRAYIELEGFINFLSGDLPALKVLFNQAEEWASGLLSHLPPELSDVIKDSPDRLLDTLVSRGSESLTAFAGAVIVHVPGILLTTVISIVAACFMTKDYRKITGFILNQFSEKGKAVILKTKALLFENLFKMLRGYVAILLVTFLELLTGLSILGIHYAPVVAACIAILDILPVVGTGTVLIPWAIIDLLAARQIEGICLITLYVIITVVRNVIEPKIIGKQVGLPPIVTLIAMYVGMKVFGFLGLFGMPILVILLSKLQEAGMIHLWKTGKTVETAHVQPDGDVV